MMVKLIGWMGPPMTTCPKLFSPTRKVFNIWFSVNRKSGNGAYCIADKGFGFSLGAAVGVPFAAPRNDVIGMTDILDVAMKGVGLAPALVLPVTVPGRIW